MTSEIRLPQLGVSHVERSDIQRCVCSHLKDSHDETGCTICYLTVPRLADGRMITHALHLTASGIHAAGEIQMHSSNGAKQNGK